MQARSLRREDPLEEEMTAHSSILAWRTPWTEESGGLKSTGSQRVRYDLATEQPRSMTSWREVSFIVQNHPES